MLLMDVDTKCSNDTSLPMCSEESSGSVAVIIIPSILALSTVFVMVLIFCDLHKYKQKAQRTSAAYFTNGQQSVSVTAASLSTPKVQAALNPWEIPEECVLEGLEFWQTGRYGPICKGLLKKKDGTSSGVVVKSLRDGPNQPEAKEFVQWVLFHARVCKHENVVQMLYCQTKRLPMYLVLDAYSPGNLLHFLWSLKNRNSNIAAPSQSFSERSVFLVAKQVAAGLDYLMAEHRLVHGDVAARNILIGPGLSARVSGLGVAFGGRKMDLATRQRAAEVPLKWQAPERIMMQFSIDRSDVWSFGILLYELITLGSPPYPELEPLSVLPKLQGSYRMERPENCGGPLYDLMKYCWMWSFKDRPAFSSIIKLLDSSLHLAATKDICVPDEMDIFEYNRQAGLLS
ncbi:tyrosine-protein kinase STYK1 isoform X2 [Scomber japonicus]|uniref:tyrosine-protein kinase STYK1 isoform X2 n=1 Tax=Scomber japonicus TaxID=13676 RepID=UPI0023052329|nr:tyrosine-protein kinase STYK1 isoform X2 [Scomber japonicus]